MHHASAALRNSNMRNYIEDGASYATALTRKFSYIAAPYRDLEPELSIARITRITAKVGNNKLHPAIYAHIHMKHSRFALPSQPLLFNFSLSVYEFAFCDSSLLRYPRCNIQYKYTPGK